MTRELVEKLSIALFIAGVMGLANLAPSLREGKTTSTAKPGNEVIACRSTVF